MGVKQSPEHNTSYFIWNPETRNRKLPDFVDVSGRRVFEYFGDYWHRPEEVLEYENWYRTAGWECTILWEHDLSSFKRNNVV